MSKTSLRQQQLQLQQQQQQQQMIADNEAAALAAEMFDVLCAATTMRQILGLYRNMCDTIGLRPGPINEFYPKLKQKIRSWKAQALWKKFDTRASHRVYNKGNACTGSRVLVIGAGPCGLRAAIEAQLLGAKVCIVEKRDRISRNNVVHLWPFVITDLRNLGAKKFYGKFCAGSIDHISIRQLQCILLKVALLLGVEIHEGVSFLNTIEPSDGCGWRAEVTPTDHAVSHYEFDVLFGADGKRNTLEGFKRKEFRGKLAIAITANFINKKTEAEARAEEISGVAFIFNQSFFKELYQTTGIDLENIVYYKDETHYFVMTAKKHSLIDKNVIIQDFADPAELLSPHNVNTDKLLDYAREAAEFSTKYQMPNLEFAVNHYGKPDVAMFDFTSMFAAEASSRVIVRKNYRLLQCLVGDSLLEPFWPTGSGCARGFLSSMDAAYMIKLYANQRNSILGVLAQRESIYRLLAQTTPENLQRDIGAYTVDPATRYPNLNKSIVNVWQVKHLIDTDDPNLLEQVHMDTNVLQQTNVETPIRRKRRTGDLMPLSTVLLRWIKAQLHAHEYSQNLTEASECITNGKILCALINRYRPDLIDLTTIKDLKPIECNELAFKILETELNIPRCISAKQSMSLENVDSKIWLNYLEQICEGFRGEIPHVKHPKLDYFELKEKSSRDKKPDFSHLLNRTTKSKAKSPMQDIDLTANVHRRSILDEDKARRQRKNAGNGNEIAVLPTGHGDTSRRAKKRRSQEKTTNIEERQQRLKEIEANRLERQSKRKQQRYQQTQNFYKSLQMLQAQNLLREDGNDEPFEDYSIYMYRQNAPEFTDRVKMLEQKLLHPDRDRGIQSAFPRSNDEHFSNRIKSMEQQITSRTTSGTDKKPKDLLRAIGKIDSNDWNIREIEKKIEQSKKTEIPGKSKEKVPKWSKEQFLARQNKMSKPPLEREESTEEKFKEIDQTLKNLDKQLKEGSIREIGERGKNKVASIAGQFGKKDDTSDEKPVPPTAKSSSKVSSVFKNQSASEKCHFCKQTVYLMEKIATENLILHRSCLKCHHCHTNLRLGAYAFDRDDPIGRFYCTQHFRLPAKAIRPMGRKLTKQQKKSTTSAVQSTGGGDPKTTDQLSRGRPETVAQLDLLDRGQTPERIEFENADAMSDGEPSLENIIDENEWTDRNFVTDSDDSESDLSSSDESDDESGSFEDADDGSPIAQTLQLATDWIGKQRYSNGGSEDSDNDFYDSSDGMLDENDADSQTEGEEFKKAREMRRQEVKLLPIPTNLPTDTETEVKSNDEVQSNDNNNFNPINDNNKNSNENLKLINNSIILCNSDNNNMNNIPLIPSKTEIKTMERDLGHPISTEIDSLNENIFNLNNFLKLNKEIDNIRKENLVKNDIMKKLSLKEKWLNESTTGASNLSLDKIREQSETRAMEEEKIEDKHDIAKQATEIEKVSLEETELSNNKIEINPKAEDSQTDFKIGVDINDKSDNTENNTNNPSQNNTDNIETIELKEPQKNENLVETAKTFSDELIPKQVDNIVNEIIESIKSVSIEKTAIDIQSEEAENLPKSVKNPNLEALKTKQKSDDKDIGQLLYDIENKCSPKVRRKSSSALKKIEARSFADTKGVIESQITGPKMSKQSSLDLSRYFPNQKQEKASTVAANKNQKTLKDIDLNQYFAQSPVPQRKSSVPTKSPAALRKSSTEKTIPALYKPTIKDKIAAEATQNIQVISAGISTNSTTGPGFTKPNAKVNQLHYTPTMKEILASGPIAVNSTEISNVIDSKPKPNILHYKPTMKEILAAHSDSPKLDTSNRPIPPKRQKAKETSSTESVNKRKTKDFDFDIYDQQVDGSVDLKKKVGNSISKTDEKSNPSTKKKNVKKVPKKPSSSLITPDSAKIKKSDANPKSGKHSLSYEDEILNEILNTDDDEHRSPSIEYQKLFQEEKSPSEDISDRIENILIETGIDLGLPRRSGINKKKILKAKSLGEDEFISNKNQLSSFEVNIKEEGDEPNGFQNILKRFESLSSVKNVDDKNRENKLKDSNDNNSIYDRRYSRDSLKSKKSSSDEFSDLERTLEYLKSEWKTEASNFLQKKRSTFFSKPKSIDELREQIEEDKEELKRNTEQYFEEKKTESKVKYEKMKNIKEKSPKRKILDTGNNKVKEIKIQPEKQPIKRKKSDEKNIESNNKELPKIKNNNDIKIDLKAIGKVKSFDKSDSELDDTDVDDIFNEIVNELHINDDKLGTPDIQEYLQSNFELNSQKNDINESATIKQISSSEIYNEHKQDFAKLESTPSTNASEKIKECNRPAEHKVRKEFDSSPIKLEKDNYLSRKSSSPKITVLENNNYIKSSEKISEISNLQNGSQFYVANKKENSPKNKTEIMSSTSIPKKDINLQSPENIKLSEEISKINSLQHDYKISNKVIEKSPIEFEKSTDNYVYRKSSLTKSISPKANKLESQQPQDDCKIYALSSEVNESNMKCKMIRNNSLQENKTVEGSASPKLNSPKSDNKSPGTTKSPISAHKLSTINRSKSSTDEDSIEQLFNQFADDMLVDVEFDSNDELVSITPRAIIKKGGEGRDENFEFIAPITESSITMSTEKDHNNIQFPMKPPRRQKTGSSSTSPDIPSIPIRAKHIAEYAKEIPPSVQDIMMKSMAPNDDNDNSLCIIPINNEKSARFPSRYEEEEDITMINISSLKQNEQDDTVSIENENVVSRLEPIKEIVNVKSSDNNTSLNLNHSYAEDHFDESPTFTRKSNASNNISLLSESMESKLEPVIENIECEVAENTYPAFVDISLNSKDELRDLSNEFIDSDNIIVMVEKPHSQSISVNEDNEKENTIYVQDDRGSNSIDKMEVPVTLAEKSGEFIDIPNECTVIQIEHKVQDQVLDNSYSILDNSTLSNSLSNCALKTDEYVAVDESRGSTCSVVEDSCLSPQNICDGAKVTNMETQSNGCIDSYEKKIVNENTATHLQPVKETVLAQQLENTYPEIQDRFASSKDVLVDTQLQSSKLILNHKNDNKSVPQIVESAGNDGNITIDRGDNERLTVSEKQHEMYCDGNKSTSEEDWEIIERLEKERLKALRKRDQMYFKANNSSSVVERPRVQPDVSSSDSFESALSKSIPELTALPKTLTPPPIPPPRSPKPSSKIAVGESISQKSLPIEVIEHPLPTADRAYSPSSTQSKNSSHSLSHSIESIPNRPQRPKSNPAENIPVDYGTRILLERSQMLRDRKKDFMDDKMVGNNPYMKKMISTERKHRVSSDDDDDVEFPDSYRPSNLNTRNINYSRFPTSRAIQDRRHYNNAVSSSMDRYGTGASTSSRYSSRLSPLSNISFGSPSSSSRHLTDYFKRSPSNPKEHHYHPHHPRDQSKDSCVQSDSESSSADDDVNSATEISTDSEFDQDPVIRETPKIFIDDTHLRKPTKVQIKQVIIGNNGTNYPPKLQNVTNTKLTSNALQNALTHQELEFKPLVQVDPSLLNSNRIMPLKNPRSGDYLLNKTASTEGIASKTSLELKKRYLLGGEQPGIGNKIMKSGSTSILDTKLKSFHSNISECQKKLNAAGDISVGMKTFLDRTTKLSSNDLIGIEKKISENEMKLKKDLEEKENVFVNSKNELNKGMEYSETVNTALIEHITKNSKTLQPIKIPSPIIETIDLISPEKEVPNPDLKQPEFSKDIQMNKNEQNIEIDAPIEIIDLTYSPPMKILEKINDLVEKTNIPKNSKHPIPDIIKQIENIEIELPDQLITQLSETVDPAPITAIKTEELDNECQDTCIQVPQIPWPNKKIAKDDVESDSLSTSSSSLADIPHYILESTTSPDTNNCGGGGIVPRLEIHDSSGALMQIDSLMIIDGKYIGDPDDLPLMEIPEGMTTSTPTITEATTIVDVTQSKVEEATGDETKVSKQSNNKSLSQIPVVNNSTKDLKFDSKNENKIESLKNLPLIYDKSNDNKKEKPQSLDLGNTVLQTSLSPITPTPTAAAADNDKTPTANDNNHHTDSETEQTGQLLTETELSDWTADDAVSENFVDIEFVLNSNKGTIKRNKKGKKGKLNSKSGNVNQSKNTLRKEKYSASVETPREGGGILENLAIGEIDFMDTGSEGSCAETYAATNNALIKNRGYIEFIENTGHNEYSPTTSNTFNIVNLRQNPKTNFSVDTKSYKRSNSAKEILGIDYIEQGACILNSNVNNSDMELKTPVNEISPPIFSIGKPVFSAAESQKFQQQQQLQSLTDSTNELDDDSLVMITSQSATNTNTTTTTEESEALTVVTSPLDSSSPKTQGNLMTTTTSSSTATSSIGDKNKITDGNKILSSNSINDTTSPFTRRKCSNEEQHIGSSSRKRSSQEDLLSSTKRKDSDEMSYEEYVRKLQQKITQISNAKDSIDVRKHKRKTSRCGVGVESAVPTINELEKKEHDEMETKDLSQIVKSIGYDTKSLSIFESSKQPVSNFTTSNSINQANVNNQHIHKVPEIPTLSSKLEEITKERTKQKDLIHDLVMDKLQSKKQLNAEKRLNRTRNRSSIFSPRNGNNDNNLMISSTPKLILSSNNGCTNNYNLTNSASEQIQNFKENIPNKKKNSSPRENKDIVQMFHQANVINRKPRPLSDNLDKIVINYHNYEQSQSNACTTGILHNSQSKQGNDSRQYITPKLPTGTRLNRNFDHTALAANTGKLKAEARARARLKTNQDLGLSPEEKLQILRKRYHLDLRDVIIGKNTSEELKARQRKMITSNSVNDISVVQQQQPLHLLTSDDNFNTTKSNSNIIDFTSDPNLSNSINCNSKPVKLNRRHKDPERRKSLIQTFSNFFNKGKKDNKDTTATAFSEISPTKDKEHKTVELAGGAGSVFSRFRISPKTKDKSKEKEETLPFEQCNLTQDCLKQEFSSTPHLFNNNNKYIDDTALAAAASGALVAVTATPGIVTNIESITDNYEYDDDDDDYDDDEEPPPIPPLPLNYQRSDDESYTTADTRDHQKKQRAISKASRQAELKRIRIAQEIQREQEEIEVQLKEYEARGVIIEKALRGEGQNIENLETSSMGASDEKLLKELLEIWRNITQLKKRDEELGIRQQELKLEHRHAQLKDELNMRLSCGKLDKSSADVAAEGAILNEMLEIVAKRAALRPNEQSTSAGSYVSSINRQSTSNESEQI